MRRQAHFCQPEGPEETFRIQKGFKMAHKTNAWLPHWSAKGWGIVLIGFFFFMFYTIWNSITNVLFGMYEQMYGWTQADMSYVITVAGWVSLIFVVIFGSLIKKCGAKLICAIGLFGSAIGFVILAMATTFTMYAVGVIVFYITMVAYATVGIGALGSSWFPRTKGSFMGFATIGTTFASAALNPIILGCVGAGIGVSGFFYGLAALCVILAIIMLAFVKNTPEEAGCYPDNDKSISRAELDAEAAAAAEYVKNSPWTTAKVLKTPQTWLIALGTGLPMMVGAGVIATLVPTFMALGYDLLFGVTLLSTMWPIGLLGHYLIGVIDQKIGTKKTTILVVCIMGLGGLLVALLGNVMAVCAVATGMFMFGLSGTMNVCMSLTTSIFGRYDFPTAYTPISTIFNAFNFAGVSVISTIFALGGPQVAMGAVFVICVIAIIPTAVLPYKQIGSLLPMDDKASE